MSEEKTKKVIKVEVEVPQEDWIDYVTKEVDIFMTGYIGYWGRGYPVEVRGEQVCWIVVEFEDHETRKQLDKMGEEAVRCFRDGLPMPERCHVLDEKMAIKAFEEGCKKWGADWFEDKGDANTYDWVLQQAMLGEQRYG